MYINDLNIPAHICKYVDDSTIYEIVQGPAESCIQQSANVAADWTMLNANIMIINSDKSKEIIICSILFYYIILYYIILYYIIYIFFYFRSNGRK